MMSGEIEKSPQPVPEETKAVPEAPKSGELTDDALSSVSGGATVITNLAQMRHEMLKSVANNLRA